VKVRWKGARFVPLAVVEALVAGRSIEEDRWAVDVESECLVPSSDAGHPAGPFRVAMRSSAAVDRLTGASVAAHSAACLELRDGAGFWAAVAFGDADAEAKWAEPVKAALRLLADSGMGGERSRGWGHSRMPLFSGGTFPELLVRPEPQTPIPVEGEPAPPIETAYWLLSLFSPAAEDLIDWDSGNYVFLARGGRVDSPAGIGAQKKVLRMVAEGSVLFSAAAPRGTARDVAPDGFPHPVYRSGLAFCIPIPVKLPTPHKVTP
jgi:CRISPR type III-A-associated RAMP protein Csm4